MTTKPKDLLCRELVELVDEYLGHTLTDADRLAFDAHLETCPPCGAYVQQIRDVLSLATSLGKAPPAEGVERELLDTFRRWHKKNPG